MRKIIHRVLHRVVRTRYVQLTSGILLLIASVWVGFDFNPNHGFALIAIIHIFQALPELLQALERIDKGVKDD